MAGVGLGRMAARAGGRLFSGIIGVQRAGLRAGGPATGLRWASHRAESAEAAEDLTNADAGGVEDSAARSSPPAVFVRERLARLLHEASTSAAGKAANADEGGPAEPPHIEIRGTYKLDNLQLKSDLLYSCMVNYGKDVPSFRLNKLQTVDDVVSYFEAPILEYGKRLGEKPHLYDLETAVATDANVVPPNMMLQFRSADYVPGGGDRRKSSSSDADDAPEHEDD
mmetsp:Transcript_8122/g.20766  ORF Transcript_8122/g.20766 Transcript_8122/m.20766 type:complete len:225 (-) Transcript_8122:39-713(-)